MEATLKGKKIFMTGATSGLGKEAAHHFIHQGAHLIVLARNEKKYDAFIAEYRTKFPNGLGSVERVKGDLNSLETVHIACLEVKEKHPKLDYIINNAGIMNFDFAESQDGVEQTFQINLLSPMLICHLLLDCLQESEDAKIIFTASGLHQGNIDFDDLEFRNDFSSFKSYRHSKLAVILLCRFLADKLATNKIGIYSQHPGMVRTDLGRNAGWVSKLIFWLMGSTPEKGAQTLIYLSECKKELLTSGGYYAKNQVAKTTKESYDMEVAAKLLGATQKYLNKYITASSLIYKVHEKSV